MPLLVVLMVKRVNLHPLLLSIPQDPFPSSLLSPILSSLAVQGPIVLSLWPKFSISVCTFSVFFFWVQPFSLIVFISHSFVCMGVFSILGWDAIGIFHCWGMGKALYRLEFFHSRAYFLFGNCGNLDFLTFYFSLLYMLIKVSFFLFFIFQLMIKYGSCCCICKQAAKLVTILQITV